MIMDYVIACNNEELFWQNIVDSPVYRFGLGNFIIKRGYTNVPQAYNDAIPECKSDLICFLHQDVFLPEVDWEKQVRKQIAKIKGDWGVVGVAGAAMIDGAKQYLGHVRDRGGEWGTSKGLPVKVDTLDELLLIVKNDGRTWFDPGVGNHFYGADICTQARITGRDNWAIEAYCHHNSIHGCDLPPDFWVSCKYMKAKYLRHLPIATTCTIVQ